MESKLRSVLLMNFPPRRKRSDKKNNSENRKVKSGTNGKAVVNAFLLAPHGSYDVPHFVKVGYYHDKPFTCRDCDKAEIWTATQQKWWFEIAKGDVFTQAQRCCSGSASIGKSESGS